MIVTNTVCDSCKQPIDTTKGSITFEPTRGGLTVKVSNGKSDAGKLITNPTHLCGDTCLTTFIGAIRTAIKEVPAPVAKPVQATPK